MTAPKMGLLRQAFKERPSLPLPPKTDLRKTSRGLLIEQKWSNPAAWLLVPFCIAWNGFLIFWYSNAFSSEAPLGAKLFPLIHVAAGVGLTYLTLAILLNRTKVVVENGEVTISHGPLPWLGFLRVPGAMVDQLYAKSHVTHGKNGPRVDYQLWMVKSDQQHQKLMGTFLSADQALYIEQQVEVALGINDRATVGELPR